MNPKPNKASSLRESIYRILEKYHQLKLAETKFIPGKSKIQYSGPVYDEDEIISMINAILDGWFAVGKNARDFELKISNFLGSKEAVFVNSGSSANLIAVSVLTSPQFKDELKIGDEALTPAVTFPTTLNPLIQNGLIPVLIDIKPETYNIDVEKMKDALSNKTRLIMLPHTLGIPNEMDVIMDFAEDHNLYVIEDACDALGSTYKGKFVGTFGIFGTFSFAAPHHITMGEGGAIVCNDFEISSIARSIRDCGRACVCPNCKVLIDPNYNCPLRFESKTGDLPDDYDKRFVYLNIGYGLRPTEIQAAMGLAQLRKLPDFIKKRKKNFKILYEEFSKYEEYFILPRAPSHSDPCWFSFPLTVKNTAPFRRKDLIQWLEKHNIETRMLFAGNIVYQPAYKDVKYRIVGNLKNSNDIMKNSFFIGVYPGLDETRINYLLDKVREFMQKYP